MITKLAAPFVSGDALGRQMNVKGYKMGKLTITVGSTATLATYVTFDGTTATTSSYRGTLYDEKFINVYNKNNFSLQAGTYVFYLDLEGVTNLLIGGSGFTGMLSLSQDCLEVPNKGFSVTQTATTIYNVKGINAIKISNITGTFGTNVNFYAREIGVDGSYKYNCEIYLNNSKYSNQIDYLEKKFIGDEIIIDCSKVDNVQIGFTNFDGYSVNVQSLNETVVIDNLINDKILTSTNLSYVFEVGDIKQIDFTPSFAGTGSCTLYAEYSNDDFTTVENLRFYIESLNKYAYTIGSSLFDNHIYANVEGYKKVRIRILTPNTFTGCVELKDFSIHKEYVDGRRIYRGSYNNVNQLINGYRFFKVMFADSIYVNEVFTNGEVVNCSAYIGIKDTNGNYIEDKCKYYDLGGNYIGTKAQKPILYGHPSGGGFIVELPEAAGTGSIFAMGKVATDTGSSVVGAFYVECYKNMPPVKNCVTLKYQKEDYDVYEFDSKNTNKDVLQKNIVEWDAASLKFYQYGYLGIIYNIPFATSNVARLKENETIKFAYLLPQNPTNRSGITGNINTFPRICVFTDRNVYHNFPVFANASRLCGSDMFLFDESTIYNRYKKWLPVNDKAKADGYHKYFPVLAEYDYSQFDGRIGATGDDNPYGNGGLPAITSEATVLFDSLIENVRAFNRICYSSMTKSGNVCAFGNYNVDDGSEPFVMLTNNGGRTWQINAYFACTDYYLYMRGGKVDLKPITDIAPYVASSLKMCRKRFNVPSDTTKEPTTPFIVDVNDQSLVTGFSTDASGNCIVTVADNVDYDGIYPIVYFENISANNEWDYICNTGFNAAGTVNNGIFFRVEKIAANQYKLYGDIGNAYDGDKVCRHIHGVNRVEAGVLVSTGESYCKDWFEGGFMYLIQQNQNNGNDAVDMYGTYPVIRLTSAMEGVNRACGAYIFSDDFDPTLLYASDEAFIPSRTLVPERLYKRYYPIPDRTVKYPATPAGIFVGKLSDIDDQTKYKCVCELHTTIIGLIQTHGHFALQGHAGQLAFSKNGFDWSMDVYDGSLINGEDELGNIYFGNKIVVFK